ncbi:hypothetical protein BWU74_25515 [Paraburkholderia caledonica]|nr:hypothetical protein BWU74_25515 [Burkholderia sp. Bk]
MMEVPHAPAGRSRGAFKQRPRTSRFSRAADTQRSNVAAPIYAADPSAKAATSREERGQKRATNEPSVSRQ